MHVTTEQILQSLQKNHTLGAILVHGSPQLYSTNACEPESAKEQSLCFASDIENLETAISRKASIVIIPHKLKEKIQSNWLHPQLSLVSIANIPLAMSAVLPHFDRKKNRFEPGIHPTAVISKSARLGKHVQVGAYAVIGDNCKIDDHSMIGSHAVLENDSQVGSHCILHPFTFVGNGCIVGHHCEIHPHTTIGSDGFGFAPDAQNIRHKIPQLGIVILEDHVELGGNCAIDRATFGATRIGKGTKFDNHCHVAHNCQIGENNVFAAGFMVAGSSEIGNNCMFGGQTVVTDHVKVGNNVIVGGKAAVTKDTLTPGAYTGYPLEPMKDAMKTLANLTHITEMRKQLAEIRKHLGLNNEK